MDTSLIAARAHRTDGWASTTLVSLPARKCSAGVSAWSRRSTPPPCMFGQMAAPGGGGIFRTVMKRMLPASMAKGVTSTPTSSINQSGLRQNGICSRSAASFSSKARPKLKTRKPPFGAASFLILGPLLGSSGHPLSIWRRFGYDPGKAEQGTREGCRERQAGARTLGHAVRNPGHCARGRGAPALSQHDGRPVDLEGRRHGHVRRDPRRPPAMSRSISRFPMAAASRCCGLQKNRKS